VWLAVPDGRHAARAVVQLRPPVEELDAFRREQTFLLRSRDLIRRTLADPAVAGLETVRAAADPVGLVEENLAVEAPAPDVLAVTLAGDRPADLVAILDALVRQYAAAERQARDDERRELDRLADGFRAEVEARERQIRLAAEANGVLGPEAAEAKHARMQGELARIEAEVEAARREVEDAEAEVGRPGQRAADPGPGGPPAPVDADPRVAALLRQRADRAAALDRARQVATDDTAPVVVELKARLVRIEKDLAAARAEAEAGVRAEAERAAAAGRAAAADRLGAARRALASRLRWRDEYRKMLTNSTRGAYDIQALLDEVRPHKEYLNRAVGERVRLDAEDARPRVAVRDGATAAADRNPGRRVLLSSLAGGLAFLAAAGAVGYLEWRTRRVDGVDRVVADLGLRVIGTVPAFPSRAKLAAAGGGGDADWRFALNEAVNSTRTMLLHAARGRAMQVVMVTSATQGEGKTSLAGQLGMSMAASGMRTLIVDCDLRNPTVHRLFDLGEPAAGVGEVLCQEADAADAVQPTAVPNLWVIPAGRCSARVVAALAQGHPLETLFDRLRGQFDFILVDSCPVLPVADALLVGQHVDGVVFSILQDVSQVPQVQVASDRLAQLNIPLLGAVVNGVRPGPGYHAYGYNYVKQLPA
jgi:capsular exopolysaccharide synthesis family protein